MKIVDRLTTKHTTSREPIRPRWIVVHDTEGTNSLEWLSTTPNTCSVQYLITRSGLIYRIGLETWACWHAGRTRWDGSDVTLNHSSVGIEIEHRAGVEDYPVWQLTALEDLILDIATRWDIRGVVSHKEVAYPRGRKTDPELDVDHYSLAAIRGRRKPKEEPDMTDEQDRRLTRIEKAVANLQEDVDRSQRASSYRESITVAITNGDHEEAARLASEALAWNKANPGKPPIVTGYKKRP